MAKNTKKIPTQSENIDNIIRYLKNPNNSNSYEQYLRPIIKQKGQQYVDKLLGRCGGIDFHAPRYVSFTHSFASSLSCRIL